MSNHASSSKHNNKRTVKQKRASSPPPPQPPPQSPSEPDEPPVSEGSQTPSYTSGSIDERNALGLTEQQLILHDLQQGLMDPISFARTPLSHITEQSERSKTISAGQRSNQEERYADYAPTKPPSFLASSSGSDRTPISPRGGAGGRNFGNESFKYASRLDEFSSPEPVPRPGTTGDGSDGSSLYSPGVRDGNKTPSSAGSFVQSGQNPIRAGHLWFLNVHTTPPYRWIRTQATLLPTQLILRWFEKEVGRGVVALDLLNCTELRSVPSPRHPAARKDLGSVIARQQSDSKQKGSIADNGEPIADVLCPFQLIYGDGVERLGTESERKRSAWVNAIWEAISLTTSMPPDSTRSETPPSTVHTRYPLPSAISTLDTVEEYDSFASESESNADDFRTATQGGRDRGSRNHRSSGQQNQNRGDSDRLWPKGRAPSPHRAASPTPSPFSPFTPLPPKQQPHHRSSTSQHHQPPLNRGSPTFSHDEYMTDEDSFTTIHPIRPSLHPYSPLDTSQSSLATQSEFDNYETASEGGRTRTGTGVTAMPRSIMSRAGGRGRGLESPLRSASELSVDTLRPQDARSPGSRSPSVTPRGSPRRLQRDGDGFIDAPPPIEITPGTPEDDEEEDDGRSKTPVPGPSAEVVRSRSPKPRSANGSEKGRAKGKAKQEEPPLSPTTEMRSPKPRSTASKGKLDAAAAAAAVVSPTQSNRLFPRTNSPAKFDIERSTTPVASPKQGKGKSAAARSRGSASEKGEEAARPVTPQGSRSPVVVRRASPLLSTQALSVPAPGEAPSEERARSPRPRTPKNAGTPPRSPAPMRSVTPPRSPFEANPKLPTSPRPGSAAPTSPRPNRPPTSGSRSPIVSSSNPTSPSRVPLPGSQPTTPRTNAELYGSLVPSPPSSSQVVLPSISEVLTPPTPSGPSSNSKPTTSTAPSSGPAPVVVPAPQLSASPTISSSHHQPKTKAAVSRRPRSPSRKDLSAMTSSRGLSPPPSETPTMSSMSKATSSVGSSGRGKSVRWGKTMSVTESTRSVSPDAPSSGRLFSKTTRSISPDLMSVTAETRSITPTQETIMSHSEDVRGARPRSPTTSATFSYVESTQTPWTPSYPPSEVRVARPGSPTASATYSYVESSQAPWTPSYPPSEVFESIPPSSPAMSKASTRTWTKSADWTRTMSSSYVSSPAPTLSSLSSFNSEMTPRTVTTQLTRSTRWTEATTERSRSPVSSIMPPSVLTSDYRSERSYDDAPSEISRSYTRTRRRSPSPSSSSEATSIASPSQRSTTSRGPTLSIISGPTATVDTRHRRTGSYESTISASTAMPPWSPIETPDSANFVMEITSSTLSSLTRMGTIPFSSVPATPATLEPSVWDDASIADETERGARSIISDDRSASPSKMSSYYGASTAMSGRSGASARSVRSMESSSSLRTTSYCIAYPNSSIFSPLSNLVSVKVLESPFSDPDASTPALSVDAATDDGSQALDGVRSRQEYMANDNGKVRSTLTRVEVEDIGAGSSPPRPRWEGRRRERHRTST
ncbi:hypothetical protein FRC04_009328 [Tulasnella sp. 424]|nr:hypothetical protein FRC04_009328 [Tulasnella sp. 424]KAG8973277.1 hypothetical protein FRC05_008992 [Tulasnella sp. 425]